MRSKSAFNHGDREDRERKALERIGMEKPSCLLCDWRWPLQIELHHVGGRAFCTLIVPLCHNHHGKASDLAKDHPLKIEGCTNSAEGMGHLLLGISDLCDIVLDELRDPILGTFLAFLKVQLKELALLLIEVARRFPNLDYGIEV